MITTAEDDLNAWKETALMFEDFYRKAEIEANVNREKLEFLVVDEGRFQIQTRIGHAFVWCQKDADIYATGDDWEQALDNAIRRYRSEC